MGIVYNGCMNDLKPPYLPCSTPVKPLPSQKELRRLFTYDFKEGVLRWNSRRDVTTYWNSVYAGKPAGSKLQTKLGAREHRYVSVNGDRYLLHRVIWKWVTGVDPKGSLHYRDGDPTNLRFENLVDPHKDAARKKKVTLRKGESDKAKRGVVSRVVWDKPADQWRVDVYWKGVLTSSRLVGKSEQKAKKEAKLMVSLVHKHNTSTYYSDWDNIS